MIGNYSTKELKITFLVLFIWGCMISFLIPTWQIPDESAHLNMIGDSIGIENLGNNSISNCTVEFGRLVHNTNEKLSLDEWSEYSTIKFDRTEIFSNGIKPNIGILKHLPATIGVVVGIVLNLPITYTLLLAELISLAVYIVICYMALKRIPIKRELVFAICFMPMCIQEAASISYDALFIPLSVLFVADVLFYKYEKGKITNIDILKLLLLLLYITYIKLPFILLGIIILSLPISKIEIRLFGKKIKTSLLKKIIVIGIIFISICAMLFLKFYDSNIFINIVSSSLTHPLRTAKLFAKTIGTFGIFWLTSFVGCLGWLDTELPILYIIYVWFMLILLSLFSGKQKTDLENTKKGIYDYFVWILAFLGMGFFTILSMVNHTYTVTLYGYEVADILYDVNEAMNIIPFIGGVQGRYFIVIFLVLLIALPCIRKMDKKKIRLLMLIYLILTMSVTILTLVNRYWI